MLTNIFKESLGLQEVNKSVVEQRIDEGSYFPLEGVSGGLVIAWDSLKLKKIDKFIGAFSVSIIFSDQSCRFDWMLLGVYGPTIASKPHDFWDEIFQIRSRWSDPWIVNNVIRFIAEKRICLGNYNM